MTTETKAGVLDAINEALGVEKEPEDEAAAAAATGEGMPEGEEASPEGETPPEGEKPAEGESKPGEKPAEGKPGEKPAEPAKKADPINDPIPKELSQETQTRMRSLIKTAKEATATRDKTQQDFDYMVNGVRATGTTPEQYGEILSWMALFNSGDTKQQEKALELIESVADRLATLLGKTRTLNDPLQGHADLQQAVSQGQMTKEWAAQLAMQRNGQQLRSTVQSQNAQANQQRQTADQELATARADLNALEQHLRQTDPNYEAKKALIVPALQSAFKRLNPRDWKGAFEDAYKAVRAPAAAGGVNRTGVPANQPLRAKQPAGGGSKAPTSMREALDGALAGLAGR